MKVSSNFQYRINQLLLIQKYLIYFLPITLVTGSFLPDLSISLVAILFLYIIVIEKNWKYLLNYFSIIYFIWCFYLIVRSIFSENLFLSLESSLFYWRFGLFSLALWYLLDNVRNFKSNIFFIFLIVFLFLSIDGFIQFVTGYNLIGYTYYTVDGQRISSMFGDEAILGNYISRILPIIIALFLSFKRNSRIYSFISVFFILIGGALILISGERTAFLYYIIFIFILMFLLTNWKNERIILFSLLSLLLLGLLTTENSIKQRVFLNSIVEMNLEKENSNFSFIPKNYEPIYQTTFKIIKQNPIFGIGTKMYREECNNSKYITENGCSTHPHNTYLQLLAETGIIGFIPIFGTFLFICCLFILHLKMQIMKKKALFNNERIVFLSALFIYFFPFIPSLNFFHNWYSIITFIPIGFCLHLFSNQMLIIKNNNK
tara:strand:- start:1643 stop:2935 length:1293 start_codon:yes stop_codon:yes gene_type:complete